MIDVQTIEAAVADILASLAATVVACGLDPNGPEPEDFSHGNGQWSEA